MKCFRRNCEFDERQLLMRGNVFQHMAILYMAALVADGFLRECGINWAPDMQRNLIIFWLGTDLAICEYILRDITPVGSRNDALYIMEGICGLVIFAGSMVQTFSGEAILDGRALSGSGAHLVMGALMTVSLIVYLIKRLSERRRDTAADEE